MNHKFMTPQECKCSKWEGNCPICDGGLAYCTVCKGAEGSLPTECPGSPMSAEVQEKIMQGETDFYAGQWVAQSTTETAKKRREKVGAAGA